MINFRLAINTCIQAVMTALTARQALIGVHGSNLN